MKRFEVIIEPPALDDINHYYQRVVESGAERNTARWFNRIVEAILDLDTLPTAGSAVPEQDAFTDKLYQRVFGRGYRIIYTIVGDRVHVLCVRGSGMRELHPSDIDWPQ